MNYMPVLFAVWFASIVEHWLNKWIPIVVKTFLVPAFTMLITLPIAFIIIGPVTTWIGDAIGAVMSGLYNFSPILAGVVLGGLWQVLVIFGIHWGIVAVTTADLAALGYDPILGLTCMVCYAQIGVVLAIIRQTKDPSLKKNAIGAFFSGLFGVTEPAIYGVTLPRKVSFVFSCIGGAVSGAIIGAFGAKLYMLPSMGVFAIPAYFNPKGTVMSQIIGTIIAAIAGFIAAFLLQFFFGKKYVDQAYDEKQAKKAEEAAEKGITVANTELVSPENGTIMPLSEVEDEVFSSGAMGKGVAIEPKEGMLYAPADGEIIMTFPTSHAIGMKTNDGTEVLMHIGMDTVNLQGKGFETLVKKGDKVKTGDKLVKFNIDSIKKAGYVVTTPIVITNSNDYEEVKDVATGDVKVGQEIIQLTGKTPTDVKTPVLA